MSEPNPPEYLTPRQQLRLSEERFRILVEGVKDYAIFMLDRQGNVASWNSGAELTKGYTADEIIGQHFSVFYPDEAIRIGWPQHELRLALESGRYEEEGWRIRKSGERFWANVVITTLYDDDGEHIGFAKVTRDLTEKRRVTVLEGEQRRISTFLAMLGHELRNPLAPISYAVALLDNEKNRSPDVVRLQEVISRHLKQITRLVDDLLEVSRITTGKIHLERQPTKLRDAVRDAVEAVEPSVKCKGLTLTADLTGLEDLWVLGDHTRLVQVVGNLLSNACKFTPSGNGHIEVSMRTAGAMAELSVKDNGIGIAPELLPEIFGLFVQGKQDPGRSQGGLGLGLALVKELVTLHGGEVSAFSRGIAGLGSEFIVRLPKTHPPASNAMPAAPGPQHPMKRVLVVDDNVDAADMLVELLRLSGYSASALYDGTAAAQSIRADPPDVAILDLVLPGVGGIDLARGLTASMARPPLLIALSGYGTADNRAATLDAGFSHHATKPVDYEELIRILEEHLTSRCG